MINRLLTMCRHNWQLVGALLLISAGLIGSGVSGYRTHIDAERLSKNNETIQADTISDTYPDSDQPKLSTEEASDNVNESSVDVSAETESNSSSTSIKISSEQSSTGNGNNSNNTSVNVNISNDDSNSNNASGLAFTKGGVGIEGEYLHVSATLNAAVTGTCNFVFKLNGSNHLEVGDYLAKEKTCEVLIPIKDFPKSSGYRYSVMFLSDDSKLQATQPESDLEIY